MRDTLRDLATAAFAEKVATETPAERDAREDPDGSKRRARAEQVAHAHAWQRFRESPLYQWFPTVQWGVGDYPTYPPNAIVVYDMEERRTRDANYFLVQWKETRVGRIAGPEVTFTVRMSVSDVDRDTQYTYWSTSGKELRSAADVGQAITETDKRRSA